MRTIRIKVAPVDEASCKACPLLVEARRHGDMIAVYKCVRYDMPNDPYVVSLARRPQCISECEYWARNGGK